MVFYKGAITYNDFEVMPLPEILNLKTGAEKINKEIIKEQRRVEKR